MARGRKAKRSLDYFPVDVDMMADIKIRKLTRRHTGKAVAVYVTMLCMIYRNGYYLRDDDDLPFLISEVLPGYTEDYIKEVISSCLDIGLFNKRIYSEENVFSSEGIQIRYREICSQMKRKGVIEEYNLLSPQEISSEENAISSEEIPISSEENSISSEEKPISSGMFGKNSEFVPQKKGKEKKINKEIKKEKFEPGFGTIELEECERMMMHNEAWKERMLMNKHMAGYTDYSVEQLGSDVGTFFRMLREKMTERISPRDAFTHFSNWLNGKLEGRYGNSSQKNPWGGRAGAKLAGEGSVSSPTTIQL
jgi:hypothetical protein